MKRKISTLLLGMIILSQSIVLQAMNARVKQPATLESMAAREYAKQIFSSLLPTLKQDSDILLSINSEIDKRVQEGTISSTLAPIILKAMPAAILDNRRAGFLPVVWATTLLESSTKSTEELAQKLATLLGNNSYWSSWLNPFWQGYLNNIPDESRNQFSRELALRLILSPNIWKWAQKRAFIDAYIKSNNSDASIKNFLEDIKQYYQAGDNTSLSIFSTMNDGSPMFHIFAYIKPVTPGVLNALSIALDVGGDVNALNPMGETALMKLVQQSLPNQQMDFAISPMIKALIDAGATIEVGLSNALFKAIEWSNVKAVRDLITYGGEQITKSMIIECLKISDQIIERESAHAGVDQTADMVIANQRQIRSLLEAKK